MRPIVHSNKTVFILPGGKYQIPLIEKAKAHGYKVVCADRDPDCAGREYVDEYYCAGLNERAKLLDIMNDVKPDGIVTDQTDAGVTVTAWLSEKMNLRGIGEDVAKLFTDKYRMREFTCKHGFPTPQYRSCANIEDALKAAKEIGYPVVVKPPSSQASKGVARADAPSVLREKFCQAQEHADDKTVIVEQFLEGPEFSVEGFMGKAKHHTLAIARKRQFTHAPMVIQSLCYLPTSKKFDYDVLRGEHNNLIEQTGLCNSMTHAEYKFSRGRFYLIEFAARGGGAGIASDIVPWVSGIDYQDWMLECILEGGDVLVPKKSATRSALLEFFDFPTGLVQKINGVEALGKLTGLLELKLNFEVGDVIQPVTDGTTRLGYFILNTETEENLTKLRSHILENISIEVS